MTKAVEFLYALRFGGVGDDGMQVHFIELFSNVRVCESSGVEALVEYERVSVLVYVDDCGRVVGESKV